MEGVEAAVFLGVYDESRAGEIVYLMVEPTANNPLQGEALRRRIATALREGECAIDRQALPDEIRLMKLPRSGRSHKVARNILRRQLRGLT
jgi:hypothetical protein